MPDQQSPVLERFSLGSQWPMFDPFLFCAHHVDAYPAGAEDLGPVESLAGRSLGSDFSALNGWSMYHGNRVPGFPQHPHRGFETISYVRDGLMDHADSLGATARFGQGDVQWMTAGAGVQHSEMFPLINTDGSNPLEMFQIWLNLPAADKMVDPYFTMLWRHTIPTFDGEGVEVVVLAGELQNLVAPKPPANSWASRHESDIAIWHIKLSPGARWTVPPARDAATNRALYLFEGPGLMVGSEPLDANQGARVLADVSLELATGDERAELLLIQGRPIGEPVAQYGPFVMNTEDEIHQAFADYRATQFGGWPWPDHEPNHGRVKTRFAVHADGRSDEPPA